MVGQPVSIFNARVKTVCLCFGIDREKAGCLPFRNKRIRSHDRIVCNNKQGKTGMKTENTLRTVRNSLLCFFMALGAGFLVACGGGGGGTPTFSTYLTDAPVEGAEYSGPTSSDVTGEGGVFTASEGVFEFSVGVTPLGSVRLDSNWADSHVTPADFMGVDADQVIIIARILQGLDNPEDGIISISQSARDLTVNLLADTAFTASLASTASFGITVGSVALEVPSVADASARLIATRQCLFSGGYMGDYRSTVTSDNPAEGKSHFVFGTYPGDLMQIEGVEFEVSSDGSPEDTEFESFFSSTVGVQGSKFTFSESEADALNGNTVDGNELTFVTPRLATGIWTDTGDDADSGTFRLTRVADTGDPTANRRVVGVDLDADNSNTVGIYALDYSADDSEFSGRYFDVATGRYSVLLLTVADGSAINWPSASGLTVTLTLSGMLGEGDTNATIRVTRDSDSDSRGGFNGFTGDGNSLGGSWCDLVIAAVGSSGDVQSASVQSKTEVDWGVESLAMSHFRIGGDVSAHRLSRYLDSGFPANTAIDSVQILG